MISKFEDPIDFEITKKNEGVTLSYSELMEVCQGGPQVGNLSINNTLIESYTFGGPLLFNNDFVYVPVFIRRASGFQLCKINIQSLKIVFIGEVKAVISLDKIEGDILYFYEDLNKTKYNSINVK